MGDKIYFTTPGLALLHVAECQLATVEGLKLRKGTPKTDLRRHAAIAATAVQAVREFATPDDLKRDLLGYSRVRAALAAGEGKP